MKSSSVRMRVTVPKQRRKLLFMSRDPCHLPASINSFPLFPINPHLIKLNGPYKFDLGLVFQKSLWEQVNEKSGNEPDGMVTFLKAQLESKE